MCRTVYYDTPTERRVEDVFQPWPIGELPPYFGEPNRPAAPQPDAQPYYVEPMRPRMPSRPCPQQQQQQHQQQTQPYPQPLINRVPASLVANSQSATPSSENKSKLETMMSMVIELLTRIVGKLFPVDMKSAAPTIGAPKTVTPVAGKVWYVRRKYI